MSTFARPSAAPLALSASTEAQTYGLFAFAIAMTTVGAWLGIVYLPVVFAASLPLFLVELVLILTSQWWSRTAPLNYLLFALFPLISGFTIIPYVLSIAQQYENGTTIVLSALSATVCMALAGAVAVKSLGLKMQWMGRALLFSVLGLVVLGLLQLFVPSLRTTGFELALSGAGVVVFALFTAYDIQRITEQARLGANPFLLALRLYLDIFNMFVYLLRFMTALSGNRR